MDDAFLKMLKSNAILMIYNLVESTIMSAILKIYDSFFQQELTYNMVRKEIQDIWFHINLIRYMIKMHTLTRIEERQKKSLILF